MLGWGFCKVVTLADCASTSQPVAQMSVIKMCMAVKIFQSLDLLKILTHRTGFVGYKFRGMW